MPAYAQPSATAGVISPTRRTVELDDPVESALRTLASRVVIAYLAIPTLVVVIATEDGRALTVCLVAVAAHAGWLISCTRAQRVGGWVLAMIHVTAAGAVVTFPLALADVNGFAAEAALAWPVSAAGGALGLMGRPIHAVAQLAALSLLGWVVADGQGLLVSPGTFVAPWGAVLICGTVGVLARRGSAITHAASSQRDRVIALRSIARSRAQGLASTDRLLHDTVLSTLAVIGREGAGVPAEALSRRVAEDLALLDNRATASFGGEASVATDAGVPTDLAIEIAREAERLLPLGLLVRVHETGAAPALAPSARHDLVLAVRELLENVRRHAGVSTATVVLDGQPAVLRVVVVDEGKGFDQQAVGADRLGLAESVLGRLQLHAGRAVVWSRPGSGTTVLLELPAAGSP